MGSCDWMRPWGGGGVVVRFQTQIESALWEEWKVSHLSVCGLTGQWVDAAEQSQDPDSRERGEEIERDGERTRERTRSEKQCIVVEIVRPLLCSWLVHRGLLATALCVTAGLSPDTSGRKTYVAQSDSVIASRLCSPSVMH